MWDSSHSKSRAKMGKTHRLHDVCPSTSGWTVCVFILRVFKKYIALNMFELHMILADEWVNFPYVWIIFLLLNLVFEISIWPMFILSHSILVIWGHELKRSSRNALLSSTMTGLRRTSGSSSLHSVYEITQISWEQRYMNMEYGLWTIQWSLTPTQEIQLCSITSLLLITYWRTRSTGIY